MKPNKVRSFCQMVFAVLAGAAIGLFAHVLGLPSLISFWGGGLPVVTLGAAVLGLVSLVLGAEQGGRIAFAGLSFLVALYVAVAVTPISRELARVLPRRDELPEKPADAVFVFGSLVYRGGALSEVALARLTHGLGLLVQGRAPVLVLSELPVPQGSHEAAARQLMRSLQLDFKMESVGFTRNSHDEAVALAGHFKKKGWKKVIAVTSPTHSKRACGVLERQGLITYCSPSPEYRFDEVRLSGFEQRVRAFGIVMHEHVGLWVYRMRGWL